MSVFSPRKKIEAGPDPAAIKQRLDAIKTELSELESEHATASLAWATGEATNATELDRIDTAIAGAKRDQRALRAALQLATEARDRANRERLEGIRRTQINAVAQHARASERAAEDFTAALDTGVVAFRKMIEARGKMMRACPAGSIWPGLNARCSEPEVRRMIQQEIARLSWIDGDLRGVEVAFPGASRDNVVVDGLDPLASPTTYPTLAERFKSTNDWLLRYFRGEPDAATPAPLVEVVSDDASDPEPKPLTEVERIALENPPVIRMA